jgi:hypothetical protein
MNAIVDHPGGRLENYFIKIPFRHVISGRYAMTADAIEDDAK